MLTLRPLDSNLKLYACFAILTCFSTAGALWILAQLPALTSISVATGKNFNPSGARVGIWLYLVATPLAAAGLARWLRAELARPVREAVAAARRVTAGDLGTKVGNGADGNELLTSMQEMNDQLVGMILKVRSGADNIASGAAEMVRGSRDLSARAVDQTTSLEEAAASIGQLAITVRRNAEHAHQAGLLARSALELAHQGGAAVAEVAKTIASVSDGAHRIADITTAIDDIAFQTNLAAADAAAAAARAGQHGRGFAAVAADVRKLAQRSAAAAREIKLLIGDSAAKAGERTAQANKAGKTMRDIADSARRVTDLIGEIAAASAAQSSAIDEVDKAVAATLERIGHSAALQEQSRTTAAAVRDQAGSLSRVIGVFTLGAEHGAAPLIHLAHSNPNKVVRTGPDRATRPNVAAVRAVAPSPSLKPVRSRGNATRRDLDWEEF